MEFHEFSRARLLMEVKYAVKMLMTDLFKFYFIGNEEYYIMTTYGKIKLCVRACMRVCVCI